MVGQERALLPLLAEEEFHVRAYTATLSFVLAFGVVKAITNFVAGTLCDRWGRKPVLVAGWVAGIPVPFLLMWAPTWEWVIVANLFLGVNQGLTWSTAVIMKIDLAGPRRRGLAMGLNEAAGYGAVAATAIATGVIASHWGLRPEPFFLGVAFVGLGLSLSVLFVRETRHHADGESSTRMAAPEGMRAAFVHTSFKEPALSATCQAGLVNNLNDGLAWGLFPILFAAAGLQTGEIGVLVALYPATWAITQLGTGMLSDRWGRKWLIVGGMWLQAVALGVMALGSSLVPWAVGSVALGLGTAMVYPTLLAAIGDVAHPRRRASAVGTYRFWRDGGYAVGALLVGVVADAWDIERAIWVVALLTAASGLVVAIRMYETTEQREVSRP